MSEREERIEKAAGDLGKLTEDCWLTLLEKDDRTSPEEYPDMCLITSGELRQFLEAAAALSAPSGWVVETEDQSGSVSQSQPSDRRADALSVGLDAERAAALEFAEKILREIEDADCQVLECGRFGGPHVEGRFCPEDQTRLRARAYFQSPYFQPGRET